MQNITFEQLVGLMAVALVLIGAYNTIMGAIKTHREEQKRKDAPVNNLEEQVKKHDERLDRDHERLNNLEEANRIQMRALMAMLHHEIDGNSTEGLKQSYDEIQRYLIEK
jgi:hypothetical protein